MHVKASLCLSNVSNNFSVDKMEKTGLYGYAYDFLVDYDSIFWIFTNI